jgi:hypothetical protein
MTPEHRIAADVAAEARALDDRFDRSQPSLIAKLRQAGVTEDELPHYLAETHAMYWKERNALLAQLAELLAEVERLTDAWRRRD